ncbi:MAG: CoA ester lyase, partial [Betaproteobacteria bacterium]
VIPKVGVPADVYALDMLVTQIEDAAGRAKRLGFEVLIETALGLANVEAIAQSSRRLEAMSFGSGDFAVSTRARTTAIGGLHPDYGVLSDRNDAGERAFHQTDPWHAAQVRMLVACRAYGLRPIDGVYGDFKDAEGFLSAAKRAAALGFDGKWAIHPSQIAPINEVFSPGVEEVERARRIVTAMEEAAREGRGAVQLDGRLIDVANVRMAENLLRKAAAIGAAGAPA